MGKKFNAVSICLLLVLGLRLMAHAEPALASESLGSIFIFLLYLLPFIGVLLRRRWGAVMSGIVGTLDAGLTLAYLKGLAVIGPVLADAALVFLSWMDFRQIVARDRATVEHSAEPVKDTSLSSSG